VNIVVLGAEGQVGKAFTVAVRAAGHVVRPCGRRDADVTDLSAIVPLLDNTDIAVNCAAYNDVDRAEAEPEIAAAVNHHAPARLAAACADTGTAFVHFSTDYVFDGAQRRPYVEDDLARPDCVYGRTKLAGERAVALALPRHFVIRPAWIFGGDRGFTATILKRALTNGSVRAAVDQVGTPTNATWLAQTLVGLLPRMTRPDFPWGIYHLTGQPPVTRYDFAQALIKAAGLSVIVEPASLDSFGGVARRPSYSALDCTRAHARLGIDPVPWADGLSAAANQIVRQLRRGGA
jgi:dTDP-4-dehydrorhamnose reductase